MKQMVTTMKESRVKEYTGVCTYVIMYIVLLHVEWLEFTLTTHGKNTKKCRTKYHTDA